MADITASFDLEPTREIGVDFQLGSGVQYIAEFSINVMPIAHNELVGRNNPDCHPIGSITGLQNALDGLESEISAKPSFSDIGNGVLTIQKNGSNIGTFSANQGNNASVNIVVPTKTSDIQNDSGFATTIELSSAVSTHNSSQEAHSYIRGLISGEVTNRQNADNNLQEQIDAINASSDVTDIVGTYAELQAYDTSKLKDNDIIKVLQDETDGGATTYYRWNKNTETFSLIGEEGPYYTKSEANSTFVPQTRTINSKALSSNITLTSDDIEYTTAGTTCTYVFDLFLTAMESLGESIGGNFDGDGTFTKSSYKTSESVPLNNITDGYDISYAVGWCDRAIGKISNLTTTVKTDCVSAINEVKSLIPTENDYVTLNTTQNITGQKTFLRTETAFQDSVARFVSTYNSSNQGWRGRVVIGAKDYTFIIGTYNGMAAIGGHKFSDSATESNADWSDIYFQPDGDKAVYFGGYSWRPNSGWFKVQNNASDAGGKTQVNIGTITNANWKDVAYKGENISDFNNNSGYITGITSSDVTTALGYTPIASAGIFYWGE